MSDLKDPSCPYCVCFVLFGSLARTNSYANFEGKLEILLECSPDSDQAAHVHYLAKKGLNIRKPKVPRHVYDECNIK